MTPPPVAPLEVRVMLGMRSGERVTYDAPRAEAESVAAHVRESWHSDNPPGDLAIGTGAVVTTWLRLADICSVRLLSLPPTPEPTPDPEKPVQGEKEATP